MNRILLPAIGMILLAAPVAANAQHGAQPAANICLNIRDIQRTETPNDSTILFHMRGGKVWRNRLRTPCPMLATSPFTQVLHNDQVCANQQFIQVIRTGQQCVLGDFTPEPALK